MLVEDVRHAVRALARRPMFTLVAVATLALGIGANAVVFGVVQAVLLRPLPFPAPDRLVQIFSTNVASPDRPFGSASPPDFVDWRAGNTVLTEMAGVNVGSFPLAGEGQAEQIPGATVTGGFFDVLGVRAVHGRTLGTGDDLAGGPDVVVIGADLWRRRFGGSAAVVGRRIRLNGVLHEVVGVMPRGFSYPLGSEVWMPLRFSADELATQRGAHYLDVIGRLEPGVTLDAARAGLGGLAGRLADQYPRTNRNSRISVHPLRRALVGDARLSLLVLLCAVGFVLLSVSLNVAGLVLTRALARGRELALRAAVGASRGRLVRTLLTESLVLASAGGTGGLLLAWWGTAAAAGLGDATGIPLLDQTRLDASVVAFTFAAALFTVLLFGSIPAWRASGVADVAGRMRRDGPNATSDRASQRVRGGLIVAQTAVALVLLIGAGLLVRSVAGLAAEDRGFDVDRLQTFAITLPTTRYRTPVERADFIDGLVSRIERRGDVVHAGAVFGLPFQDFRYGITTSTVDGRTLTDDEQDARILQVRIITPGYLEAMGITVTRGRHVTAADRLGAPLVALLSETAARLLWPGESAIGHHLELGTRMGQGGARAGGTVVGIVADVHDLQPGLPARPTIYLAHAQMPVESMSVVARSSGDPSALVEPLRAMLATLDPDLPMFRVRTMEQLGATVLAEPRLYAWLLAAFAVVAVLLAALGLYGMLAHFVGQRTREIGIRLALGAQGRTVARRVMGQAVALVFAGLGIGLGVALAASPVIDGLLFRIQPTDVPTYAAASGALLAVGLVASWLPARRAARIDPVRSLRMED